MADNPLVKSIKEKLDAMEPQKRQKVQRAAIIAGIAGLMVILYYSTGQEAKKPQPAPEAAKVIELGDARLQDDMRATFSKGLEEQTAQNKKLGASVTEQDTKIQAQDAQIRAMQSLLEQMAKGPAMGLPDVATGGSPSTDPMDWQNGTPSTGGGSGAPPIPAGTPQGPPPPPTVDYIGGVGRETGAKQASADGSKKKGRRFYLPPSFMPAKLLTGLAAKTVENAKSDPEPMMLRVQAPAVLPNEVRSQLQGCLVVGHGFGSLASERVEAQLVSISCLDFEGKSMIDSELHGIVVDKDGVKGLAGHPVSKMATNLARLAFAGAIQGAAAAFGQSATTTSVSPLGQTQTIDPNQLGRAGAGKGVENASNEYARIIADLVRQQTPVIEVGPAKDVTVVVTEGAWLEIKDLEEGGP